MPSPLLSRIPSVIPRQKESNPESNTRGTPPNLADRLDARNRCCTGISSTCRTVLDTPGYLIDRGAGGNRTPVRQVVTTPDTTIPDSATHSRGTGGSAGLPTEGPSQLPGLSPMSAVFACCQRSFPAVHPHFCCRAVRIRPRAPLPVTMTLLQTDQIRLRERTAHRRFFFCPRFSSLRQLGSLA